MHTGWQGGGSSSLPWRQAGATSSNFRDQLDLDTRSRRDLSDAERAAGVRAPVAEYLAQQLAGAIGHQVLLGEIGRRVDQAHHLDDALDLAQVAHGSLQRAHEVDRDRAGGGLALFGVHVLAELADPGLAVL